MRLCGQRKVSANGHSSHWKTNIIIHSVKMSTNLYPELQLECKSHLSGLIITYRVYATISFTFDLLKCRAQTTISKRMLYREEILRIFRNEGLLGFSVGYRAMIYRDIISFGFYFMFYEMIKQQLSSDTKQLPFYDKMLAGGLAGVTSWALGFPFDSLKLRF